MATNAQPAKSKASPEKQLNGFIEKYTPEIAALVKAARAKMQTFLPGAVELVYDNFNALAIGFGPSERASEATFSIAVYPRRVNLCFLWGKGLPDPKKILRGGGNQVRNIILTSADVLDRPEVRAVMKEAIKRAKVPIDASQPGRVVIRAVQEKQRPRRPAK